MEPLLTPPNPTALPPEIRGEPDPLHGGPIVLLRFLREHRMLNWHYAKMFARLARLKLKYRGRLTTDGIAFVCPQVHFEIGPNASVHLGRWSWLGHGTKVRAHEGEISIGAKSVLGQECTISCYKHVSIGRECIIADRTMFIDFDHGIVEVERPIRAQGIYMRDVVVGNNVWMGYGACVLRGVTVGDNTVIGTNTVVTKDLPADVVAGGVPAEVIRKRGTPKRLRWS